MRPLVYLLSFVLALPCTAFAVGILTLNQVIVTRNVFKLFYQFLLAFGWGVPLLPLVLLAFLLAGFFPMSRVAAAALLVLLNVGAIGVILASPASPKNLGETAFLVPSLLSTLLAGLLVAAHFR